MGDIMPVDGWSADTTFLEKAQFYATRRAGIRGSCAGPETGFAARYRPKLGRHVVRLTTTPDDGYLTAEEALNAAKEYRRLCREAVAREMGDV